MKYFLLLFLFLTYPALAETPTEKEFYKFFNEKESAGAGYFNDSSYYRIDDESSHESIAMHFLLEKIKGDTESILLTIYINIKTIEKLLVLRIPETGYDKYGLSLKDSCANAPIFLYSHIFHPNKKTRKIKLKIKYFCDVNNILIFSKAGTAKPDFITKPDDETKKYYNYIYLMDTVNFYKKENAFILRNDLWSNPEELCKDRVFQQELICQGR